MTTPSTPSAEEMQKLLEIFKDRAEAYLAHRSQLDFEETADDANTLAFDGLKLLSYIRTLEQEHRMMREYVQSRAKNIPDCPFDPEAEKIIKALTLRP